MKKLMITVATLALYAGNAQAADQDINIGAEVSGFCTLTGFTGALDATLDTDTSGNVVDENVEVPVGDVKCNGNTEVKLSSLKGGVFSAVAAPSGFQNRINYVASVTAPTAASVTANKTTPSTTNGTAAFTGGPTNDTNVTVTIDPTLNTDPLVAATDYSDTLTLSITAQ
jgi:opacity protein-like surface antigen